jgi:hypothetical protein
MKTFKFNVKVSISDNWIEDGWNEKAVEERLRRFIEEEMCPYAYPQVEFIADIKRQGSTARVNINQ